MVFFLGQLYGFCRSATYVFHNIFMLLFHIQMGTFLETNGHFLLPLLFFVQIDIVGTFRYLYCLKQTGTF